MANKAAQTLYFWNFVKFAIEILMAMLP